MMKWLRKHTKQIMVVVVLLAMFSFVGGSALISFLSPKGMGAYAHVFGKEVSYDDLLPAQRDTEILERVGIRWKMGHADLRVDHWFMLSREADRSGIVVTEQEIDNLLQRLQQQGLSAAYLEELRNRSRITLPDIRDALGRYLAISKNARHVYDAALPSLPEVQHFVKATEDKVKIRYVYFDAQNCMDKEEPLSEEALLSQFEKGKDSPVEGSELGFGYRHPDRVKLQYVVASIERIQSTVQLSDEEVKAYWKANKSNYKKTEYVDEPASAADASASQPTSAPAEKKKQRVEREKLFSEARPEVERDLRQRRARKQADSAMNKIANALLRPWLEQVVDPETGFKPIPQEVDAPDYMQKICDKVSREFGVELDYAETPLLSKKQLGEYRAIGGAATVGQTNDRMPLADYAFRVPSFLSKNDVHENSYNLQLYQTPDAPLVAEISGGFKIEDGRLVQTEPLRNLVIFRVVEAVPASPPKDLAEVREDVDRDVRLARAFDRLQPQVEEFRTVALRLGVNGAAPLYEEAKKDRKLVGPTTTPFFARIVSLAEDDSRRADYSAALREGKPTVEPSKISNIGVSEEFVAACFEMAKPDWENAPADAGSTERVAAATTQPAASPLPVVRSLAMPKTHRWFVIELLDVQAVDEDAYETQHKADAYNLLAMERGTILTQDWFRPESIEHRCGFKPVRAEGPLGIEEGLQQPDTPEMPIF